MSRLTTWEYGNTKANLHESIKTLSICMAQYRVCALLLRIKAIMDCCLYSHEQASHMSLNYSITHLAGVIRITVVVWLGG